MIAGGLLILVAVVVLVGPTLHWAPIDFCRFHSGSKMILAGQNPYGRLPFFAPPWFAFLLSPLLLVPCSSAALAWTLINVAVVVASSYVLWAPTATTGRQHRPAILSLTALLPYPLFTYMTGQLSIVALCACVLSSWGLISGLQWPVVASLVLATLKPHILALPMLLVLLELIRRRRWQTLIVTSVILAILGLIAAFFVPTWPRALLSSWASGGFYEPRDNLLGLAAFNVPLWLTCPFLVYVLLLWKQRGLDRHVMALAVATNLLVMPYSRSYDYVLLLIPLAVIWTTPRVPHQRLALGLAASAQFLPLIRILLPQAGLVEALAPTLCMLGLLAISHLNSSAVHRKV